MSFLFGESGRAGRDREIRAREEMARVYNEKERDRKQEKKKVMADFMVSQYKIHWRHLKDTN